MRRGLNYPATWRCFLFHENAGGTTGTLIPVNFGRSRVIRAPSIARQRRRRVKGGTTAAGKFAFSLKYLSPIREKAAGVFSLYLSRLLLPTALFVIALRDTTAINVSRNEVLPALTNARKLRTYASRTLSLLICRKSIYPRRDVSFSFCLPASFLSLEFQVHGRNRGVVK